MPAPATPPVWSPFDGSFARARPDELGAHVSASGSIARAPGRARERGSGVLQLFTKQPSRWSEPSLDEETVEGFREARIRHDVAVAGAHDSYLINLSSPDRRLWRMSQRSFAAELRRCTELRLEFLVTHPGNATDGDLDAGLERNARGIAESLAQVEGATRVLLELTAGGGTTVGATFENLRAIIDRIPEPLRDRVGVCVDMCHAFSAGYDFVDAYEDVWTEFEHVLGWERLGLIHLNDSKHPLGSRKDRHEAIGEGTLGTEPFRRIMCDPRLDVVPKILETPKGDDGIAADVRNLSLLRSFRAATGAGGPHSA